MDGILSRKGPFINYVDKQGVGVRSCLSNFNTTYACVENLSMKGEGVKNPQSAVNVIYEWPKGVSPFLHGFG